MKIIWEKIFFERETGVALKNLRKHFPEFDEEAPIIPEVLIQLNKLVKYTEDSQIRIRHLQDITPAIRQQYGEDAGLAIEFFCKRLDGIIDKKLSFIESVKVLLCDRRNRKALNSISETALIRRFPKLLKEVKEMESYAYWVFEESAHGFSAERFKTSSFGGRHILHKSLNIEVRRVSKVKNKNGSSYLLDFEALNGSNIFSNWVTASSEPLKGQLAYVLLRGSLGELLRFVD